ncbi:ribosome hibernation-promoting factor, HPF/YfiA family [Granulicoccus sp. GXG6511]|uniref:ribosome hibernation-promoting factor, HPF/YfiA family n=1 Tax=Granulicoccus sp. GXG6511 TaxID=3381351 RepID=UPI003D7DB86F
MDVTVTGRHCQVSDEFRAHVMDRITRIDKLSERVIRVEVQISATGTKRAPDEAVRAEITLRSRGPVIRAEACANDKVAAFEQALDKLMARLRRAADRRRDRRGHRGHQTIRDVDWLMDAPDVQATEEDDDTRTVAGMEVKGDGPLIVREKEHAAAPMSLDRALEEMELVGHDFYLFVDKATGAPSVVYRRKAYDYGVIRLAMTEEEDEVRSA